MLNLYLHLRLFEATRVWSLNTRNTIPFHLKKPYWVDKELQGRRYVAVYVVLGGKTEPVIFARPTVSLKLQCSMPVFERPANLRRDYLFFSRQPLLKMHTKMHLDFDIFHWSTYYILITTFPSMIEAKLRQQRLWPCHQNDVTETLPTVSNT